MQKFDKYLKIIWIVVASLSLILALALILLSPKNLSSQLLIPANSPPKPTTTTLFLAGDIMLSRNVADKMIKANDYTLPFQKTAAVTKSTDIAFANLESPFNDQGQHFIPNSLIFNADPRAIEGLKYAGFDVLSTANNHSFDQGLKGINYTLDWLAQHGIRPVGTGADCHAGQILQRNGTKFGFLAYSYAAYNDGGKKLIPLVCDANDLAQVSLDIQTLKPKIDFLIVSMHMGIEYTRNPSATQTNFAHNAIDSGADLIVGAHPHWVQTIEQYQGKWIFYSLGNFVFDQMWSTDTRQGLTVKLTFTNKALTKIDLLPVIIDDYSTPRLANNDEIQAILAKIGLTSGVLLDHN